MRNSAPTPTTVLLFDGACGLCHASVRFLLRHERSHSLQFAPLAGQFGAAVQARHPELASADSIVWVTDAEGPDERVAIRSAAAFHAARYLGGPWTLLRIGTVIPRPIRDWLYDLVARHRHRMGVGSPLDPPGDLAKRILP